MPVVLKLKAGVLAEPVLVGRERELEELMHILNSALEGKGKRFLFRAKREAEKQDSPMNF